MLRTRTLAVASVLTFCVSASVHAQAPARQAVEPVRVGLIAPLTGGSADFGNSVRLGAELAVKEINQAGGYLGRPFELVICDDRAVPDEGRKAALNLVIEEKVDFTLGYCNTGVAMKSIDVFQENKHLLMVPCSQGTAVTAKYPAAQSYIFRVASKDLINAQFLVAEIIDRRQLRKVAIFADITGYGEGGVVDVTAELAKRGLKPLSVTRFPLGVKSLTEEMRVARDAGADALLVYTVGPEEAAAAKSRHELGWKVPFFAPWPLSFRSVLEQAGAEALEGTMMAQTIIQDTANERRASFLARYFQHSNEKRIGSLMAAAQTYDAMHLMLFAMFQAQGTGQGRINGETLKHALENKERSYRGVVTTYEAPFSKDDHDAFSVNMVWLGAWKRGEVVFHYADDAKRSSFIRRKE